MTPETKLETSYSLSSDLVVAIEIVTRQADPERGDHIVALATITLPRDGEYLHPAIRFGNRIALATEYFFECSPSQRELADTIGSTHAEARAAALAAAESKLGELREMVRARRAALEAAGS